MNNKNSNINHFDVLIVGAGLSGIGAAHHLQKKCPKHSFAILEARHTMGGTWDLFRYPGIRSDSDMYTLGYIFRPWKAAKAIADGPSILKYIQDTATEGGIDKKIRYHHKVKKAAWSTSEAQWQVEVEKVDTNELVYYTCNFLFMCSGYYNYDEGYTPEFKGVDDFKGRIVHPQKWTKDINYKDKKVVVIGSGATAVTLVPELAKDAELVTMLQRSPTYMSTGPTEDKISLFLRRVFPMNITYSITRWKNILMGMLFFNLARRRPNFMKKLLKSRVKNELGEGFDIDKHFTPSYNPWDQRLCLVPDSDLFEAMKEGKAQIITNHIDKFTPKGIQLQSGDVLEADLIITATGLKLKFMAGLQIEVDGKKLNPPDLYCYRGMMFSDVPNLALAFGYTNASWTLKCDLTCDYVCRLLKYMEKNKLKQATPRLSEESMEDEPLLDFNSGYVLRSIEHFPKQGAKKPWKLYQNYVLDIFNFRYSSFKDKALELK